MKNTILLYALLFPLTALAQRVETDPQTRKKGLVDPVDGIVLAPFEYDYMELLPENAWVKVGQNEKYGLMDTQGHLLVPVQYASLHFQDHRPAPYLFASVTTDITTGKWGLVDMQGRLVVPMEYGYVDYLDNDLLAARFAGDTVLHFFDGRGQALFSVPGRTAVPVPYTQNVMALEESGTTFKLFDRKGMRPFSGQVRQPRWTDGRLVICGPEGRQGILNAAGDTVLPCAYEYLYALCNGNFVAKQAEGLGVIDATGRSVIPPVGRNITLWSERPAAGYVVEMEKGFSLYDWQGRPVTSADRMWFLYVRQADRGRWSPPGENLDQYINLEKGERRGLYHETGRQVVPVEYASVRYYADGYAVIAERPDGLSDAYNIQGKKLLPQAFARLEVTRDSMLLLGQGATKKWGFIHLDRPAEARFEFDQLIALPSGFFATQGLAGWQILDPALRRVAMKRVLEKVEAPGWADFYQFYKKKHPGRLVALVRVKGEAVMYGVNDQGAMFAWGLQPGKGEEPVIQDAGDRN